MKPQASENYRLLASQYLRKQAKQVAGQLDGIRRGESPEFVHRARVASRRLRAGLRLFRDCFPGKAAKRWRKEIRRLTKELGAARDKDVQIEFLCNLLCQAEDRACYPGIARLLAESESARESLQPAVLKAVERLRGSRVLEEMSDAAKGLAPEAAVPGNDSQNRPLFRLLGEHIVERLDEFLACQESLARPQDRQGHHAMRIAAKRLRYTIEICRPLYDSRLDDYLAVVKEVQGLLGDIHDCDVWIEQVQAFLEEHRQRIVACYGHDAPLARLQGGIQYLRRDREGRRGELFQQLVTRWHELEQTKLWDRLVQIVYVPGDTSPAPPDAAPRRDDVLPLPAHQSDGRSGGKDQSGAPQRRVEPASELPISDVRSPSAAGN